MKVFIDIDIYLYFYCRIVIVLTFTDFMCIQPILEEYVRNMDSRMADFVLPDLDSILQLIGAEDGY